MKYIESGAFILSETKSGERIVSCGGRISTRPGSAIELYKKATDKLKNLNLVSKVVASGHKTVLEHHYFNIAFNNVSIFVEQFLIEFRLASFTIKSGRYVNFSNAGFNLPNGFSDKHKSEIKRHFKYLFGMYDKFVQNGVPVEDARFVLPYGLKTNIYMSMNARELVHIICTMIYGRGKNYPEIFELGNQLKSQFDERYAGIIEQSKKNYDLDLSENVQVNKSSKIEKEIEYVSKSVELLSYPNEVSKTINEYAKCMGYESFDFKQSLKDDKMARLLEQFNYTFKVENFSVIILKHFTRHRMQALATPSLQQMSISNKFIIPESIASNEILKKDFENCILQNRKLYKKLVQENVNQYLLVYIMPHATATSFITTINAREILHLCNLRACNRAQWEIRYLVTDMLKKLKTIDKETFANYGPSCYTFGVCPEGRLCCGKQIKIKEKFGKLE